jgi:hypothetical protein
MAKTAGMTQMGGLGGAKPNASSGGNPATDGNSFYKVKIQAQTENAGVISIIADCPAEFAFDTAVDYDSPYQNMVEETLMNAVPDRLRAAAQSINKLAKLGGTKAFTQALTAKVWNGAGSTTLSLPLIFQVEKDADVEVMMPLMQLMYLSMPKESLAGGFLSSPGPRFNMQAQGSGGQSADKVMATSPSSTMVPNTQTQTSVPMTSTDNSLLGQATGILTGAAEKVASLGSSAVAAGSKVADQAAAAVSKMIKDHVDQSISVQIGGGFYLDNVVIKSVNQTQRISPIGLGPGMSSGINAMIKVDVVFETFYTLTQRDIMKMLMPMGNGNAPQTAALYNKLIG